MLARHLSHEGFHWCGSTLKSLGGFFISHKGVFLMRKLFFVESVCGVSVIFTSGENTDLGPGGRV
jgi:hypothetical protein